MKKMNTVDSIYSELEEIKNLHLIEFFQVEVFRKNVLKAKLPISEDLFIQVYRNDRFKTTNLALILNRKRIYGRDELNGKWHRHPLEDPAFHDESKEGKKECNLKQFWKEISQIIRDLHIIL